MTAEPLSDEALFARLVACDTTSHKSNREIADFISDYLDRPGVRITRHPTAHGAKLNLIVGGGPILRRPGRRGQKGFLALLINQLASATAHPFGSGTVTWAGALLTC